MQTRIEVIINNEKVLTGYEVLPRRFAEVYYAVKILWPQAIVQFEKEKKDVSKI